VFRKQAQEVAQCLILVCTQYVRDVELAFSLQAEKTNDRSNPHRRHHSPRSIMTALNPELGSVKELSEKAADVPTEPPLNDSDVIQTSPFALFSLMVGISLAAFLVALDRTIVANAIPHITDEFKSPDDAGWYGSAASFDPRCDLSFRR
jgi:hypothetical protein